ncbi:MAG: hypothetical protein RLZZ490_2234 [Cyanobacteriota bacterium]|jgi:rhodanese-related sulfurtransferase
MVNRFVLQPWLMGGLGVIGLMALMAIAVVVIPRGLPSQGDPAFLPLTKLEQQITEDYPTVNQVSPAIADQWLRYDSPPPLVLDIREPEEYQVSHLPWAINIPPDTPIDQVVKQYLSPRQPGQKILVYCSVGVRSSLYAQHLQGAGIGNIYNLQGSIFAWANQELPLQRQGKKVHQVHGYNHQWEKYLSPQYRSPLDD